MLWNGLPSGSCVMSSSVSSEGWWEVRGAIGPNAVPLSKRPGPYQGLRVIGET
jgi:hypothetical protein